MYYKILFEPAKSNKSTCRNCSHTIDLNTLRIKVVDARKLNQYIRKVGRQNCECEGLHRGYFEGVGPRGENIPIEKYFVHMNCYEPIEAHPFEKQYFDTKSFKAEHKRLFEIWLSERAVQKENAIKEKKSGKKEATKEKPRKESKSKRISKISKRKSLNK